MTEMDDGSICNSTKLWIIASRVPLGPFIDKSPDVKLASTPFGIKTGFFAILDIIDIP
jgi:hypothetical protein